MLPSERIFGPLYKRPVKSGAVYIQAGVVRIFVLSAAKRLLDTHPRNRLPPGYIIWCIEAAC
jgi:hypothetical protein